jgi:hypothetical protein
LKILGGNEINEVSYDVGREMAKYVASVDHA